MGLFIVSSRFLVFVTNYELPYAGKIGSNFEGRPFVKYQILEIVRNVKTFFETLTINVLEFKISPALKKNISKLTTNL